jgi:hypothetical protein
MKEIEDAEKLCGERDREQLAALQAGKDRLKPRRHLCYRRFVQIQCCDKLRGDTVGICESEEWREVV